MSESARHSRRDVLRNGLLLGGALTGGIQLLRDEHRLEVVRRTIRIRGWTHGRLKIGFLTDPHVTFEDQLERAERAVDLAAAEKPDILLLGGDYVNGEWPLPRSNSLQWLYKVARTGIPAAGVLGNHDMFVDPDVLLGFFRLTGVRGLVNEKAIIGGIPIVGLADALFGDPAYGHPSLGDPNVLCLLHEPDGADQVPKGTGLVLSGHSHGGQVVVPGLPRRTPALARKYIAGLYETQGASVYVSRGIGTTGVKFRLFCRPEVSILTIEAA